jgi:hypothetical protein
MDNKEIATLTTSIVASLVSNSNMAFKTTQIASAYEQIYKVIKKVDQDN